MSSSPRRSPEKLIQHAEQAGFAHNICAWIKGIYAATLQHHVPCVIAVTGGDCSNTPYLGARLKANRSDKWRFSFFGAIGGFGVGSESAWQAFPQVGYRFSSLFELHDGYRAISMDYSNGSGVEQFDYDITTFGPQVGARFHF